MKGKRSIILLIIGIMAFGCAASRKAEYGFRVIEDKSGIYGGIRIDPGSDVPLIPSEKRTALDCSINNEAVLYLEFYGRCVGYNVVTEWLDPQGSVFTSNENKIPPEKSGKKGYCKYSFWEKMDLTFVRGLVPEGQWRVRITFNPILLDDTDLRPVTKEFPFQLECR